MVDNAPPDYIELLLNLIPSSLILLASGTPGVTDRREEPSQAAVDAARAALTLEDKRNLLKKVLRSPQFQQSLGSMSMAIRDGGLPSLVAVMRIRARNEGWMPGGGMPMGGDQALETFVEGVKKTIEEEEQQQQ